MTNPTEKQITFAKSLGIERPENYTKSGLSAEIDKLTGGRARPQPQQSQTKVDSVHIKNEVKHDIVTTRADRPHSFEFGKAGMRHKIYYEDIKELQRHIESLIEAGLAEPLNARLEEIKPQDFE